MFPTEITLNKGQNTAMVLSERDYRRVVKRSSEGSHIGTRAGLGSMSEDLGPKLCLS